jgi:pimeloyl-ACP methyl ester carboxylesterase
MSAITAAHEPVTRRPAAAPRRRSRRERLARLERPFLLTGLLLVTAHLLDLALSGPSPTLPGLLAIVAAPAAWALARPRVTRATRLGLGLSLGLLFVGFGVVSHGLHAVTSGLDWRDLSGIGSIAAGALLAASGLAAVAAPRRTPRRQAPGWRAAHGVGWLAGACAVALLVVGPVALALLATHAPRWPIHESSLGIPHEEVRIATADGRELAAWYVPSRNGAAVLVSHGSGGSRARVVQHVRMLARHGYGVLAYDLPGNGESEGHSNGFGYNAQPAVAAALGYLAHRPDVQADRIAGFGLSLGGEVLLEAAAHDDRLQAVVSDGATRPMDAQRVREPELPERVMAALGLQAVRAVSGMRPARSLLEYIPAIAPRPVLLVAGGGMPEEIPANRLYRAAGGDSVQLIELPQTGHTAGLRTGPLEYERRTVGFLDRALGVG